MEFECQESTEVSENFVERVEISNPGKKSFDNSKCALSFYYKKGISKSGDLEQLPCVDGLSNCGRSITDLPSALICEILSCLDPKELGVVSCVSTVLNRLAAENRVWKEVYCERWGLPVVPVPLEIGAGLSDDMKWKELFVEREFRSRTFLGRYSINDLHGHTEAVKTVFLLASARLIFTSGYDGVVRMWDLEQGLLIESSRPLGCTIRAVAADTRLLVAGGTDSFIQGWKAVESHPNFFDLKGLKEKNAEFKLWGHDGPITSLSLDLSRIYSGSWDMTVRIWDRSSLKCIKVLQHSDWVWSLVPHDTTVASTSGSDVYVWDSSSGTPTHVLHGVHAGNAYSLARSHNGDFLFTGGEDGAIHMFDIRNQTSDGEAIKFASWVAHTGPVYSLAFEFPWLVSSSSDGKLSLIDVRKLLRTSRCSSRKNISRCKNSDYNNVEPPQRMLHGFGHDLFSVDIGADRIVCGGEEGVVRIWDFTQALEHERRACASRGRRLENRMRRRKLQTEMNSKGGRPNQCSVAANKNPMNGDRSCTWHNRRRISGKVNT